MAFGETGERRSILRPYVNLSTKKSLDLFGGELCEQRNVIKVSPVVMKGVRRIRNSSDLVGAHGGKGMEECRGRAFQRG